MPIIGALNHSELCVLYLSKTFGNHSRSMKIVQVELFASLNFINQRRCYAGPAAMHFRAFYYYIFVRIYFNGGDLISAFCRRHPPLSCVCLVGQQQQQQYLTHHLFNR